MRIWTAASPDHAARPWIYPARTAGGDCRAGHRPCRSGPGRCRPGRQAQGQASDLALLIPLLGEQTQRQRHWHGLRIQADSYQVMQLRGQPPRWHALPGHEPVQLPTGWQWHLHTATDLAAGVEAADGGPAPQLVVAADGQMTPFRLQLRPLDGDQPGWLLHGDGFNLPQLEVAP